MRQAARKAVESLGMHPLMAETTGARAESPRRALLDQVRDGDFFLLLLGSHYGEPGATGRRAPEVGLLEVGRGADGGPRVTIRTPRVPMLRPLEAGPWPGQANPPHKEAADVQHEDPHHLAALAAAVTVMTLGVSAAPASANEARLTVNRYIGDTYNVSVTGVWTMSQAQAQTLINRGYKVAYRVWGEDLASDDLLLGPFYATAPPNGLSATPRGLEFHKFGHHKSSQLNEDDSVFDRHDELYAGVRLLNPSFATVRAIETNRVGGYF